MTDTALPRAVRPRQRLSTRRKLGLSKASVICASLVFLALTVGSVFSPSGGLVFWSGVSLALIILLLWNENEPPLLLFPALYQWLSVSIKPVLTIFQKVPVNALAEWNINIDPGIALGLFGVTALSIGMRLGLGRSRQDWNATLRLEALSLTPKSLLRVAISAILLGHLLFYMMRYAGGFGQIVYALAGVRFAGLFALAYWCFITRRGFAYLLTALAIEIGIGITGFFSDFRAPIFIVAFAALAAGHRPKLRDGAVIAVTAATLVLFGSFWSEIKLDYRTFVSGGTNEQVITVPLGDRIDYLVDEVRRFDSDRFADGFDKLMRRQSYIDYESAVMAYVPSVTPHENGKRLGATFIHVMTPRFLFPDKAATEFDSEVTARYTGLGLRVTEGTSISIGYLGELYIDFGSIGAVIGSLILGLCFGLAYRYLRQHGKGSVLLSYGARATVLSVMMPFESALIKYVGGVAMAFAAAYALQIFLVPPLSRQLKLRKPPAASSKSLAA